jgi:hypothetical protein
VEEDSGAHTPATGLDWSASLCPEKAQSDLSPQIGQNKELFHWTAGGGRANQEVRYDVFSAAKALSDAIYQQKEVVERLARVSEDIRAVGNTALVARTRTEFHAVGKPGVGLGTFDPEADIATLEISA